MPSTLSTFSPTPFQLIMPEILLQCFLPVFLFFFFSKRIGSCKSMVTVGICHLQVSARTYIISISPPQPIGCQHGLQARILFHGFQSTRGRSWAFGFHKKDHRRQNQSYTLLYQFIFFPLLTSLYTYFSRQRPVDFFFWLICL